MSKIIFKIPLFVFLFSIFSSSNVFPEGNPLREIDARVIDAAAVGLGRLVQVLSERLKTTVSGHAQHYGLAMAVGVLVAVAFVVFGL